MTKPKAVTRLVYVLWVAVGIALVVLILSANPGMKTRLDYMVTAELLLVFVIAVEGVIAIRALTDTQRQLQFEAMLKIYDFSRELHTLGFRNPNLWKAMSLQRPDTWNEEQELKTRFEQLFMNLHLIEWKADQLGYFDREEWGRDAEDSIRKPEVREFWKTHHEYYPKDFQDWVDGVMKN
jgi:hypothetical protein